MDLNDIYNQTFISKQDLIEAIKSQRFMNTECLSHYHTHTFWLVWEDPDYGSNQAVFNSLEDLFEFMSDGLSFKQYDGPFIVEEQSSIRR